MRKVIGVYFYYRNSTGKVYRTVEQVQAVAKNSAVLRAIEYAENEKLKVKGVNITGVNIEFKYEEETA